jgi:hypothetical protein
MKKILLACCVFLTTIGYAQVITDGSFENWTTELLYENTQWWEIAAQEGGIATKSTDRVDGNFSIHLETSVVDMDTLIGFALYGQFGENGPEEGLPFLSLADTAKISLKYDIMPGDTGLFLVSFLLLGEVQSMDVFTFTGNQATWKEFVFPLSIQTGSRDSVVIAVVSSNALGEVGIMPGSWMQVDNIHFASSISPVVDEIRNGSFEDWFNVEVEDLDSWSTLNAAIASMGETSARKVPGANLGTNAVRLETIELYFGPNDIDTIQGYITNGDLNDQFFGDVSPVKYTGSLDGRVSGDYKYSPAGPNEIGFVSLDFYKDGQVIESVNNQFSLNRPIYTGFNFEYHLTQMPDSFLLFLFAGNIPGTSLTMDNLTISDLTDVANLSMNNAINVEVFPNPANENINISLSGLALDEIEVQLVDVLGNKVSNVGMTMQGKKLVGNQNLTNIESGIYLYQVRQFGQVIKTGKFTKL